MGIEIYHGANPEALNHRAFCIGGGNSVCGVMTVPEPVTAALLGLPLLLLAGLSSRSRRSRLPADSAHAGGAAPTARNHAERPNIDGSGFAVPVGQREIHAEDRHLLLMPLALAAAKPGATCASAGVRHDADDDADHRRAGRLLLSFHFS